MARARLRSDEPGTCVPSLRSERVVLYRLDACHLTRKWRLFLRLLSGTREMFGGMDRSRTDGR